MENSGQAPEAPTTTDDVAQFILDNDLMNDDEPSEEDNPIIHSEEEESDPEEAPEEDEDPDAEPEPEQTSQKKYKVPVKGEDGAEEVLEVDEPELIRGYQRHAKFTQLAQGLAERERQAAEAVRGQVQTAREHYMQQTQTALQAVHSLVGFRSEAEMQQLAVQDPTAWVQERQRQEYIRNVFQQVEGMTQQERQRAQQEQQQALQQTMQASWQELSKEGIDTEKLKGIYQGVSKAYGLDMNYLASNITDARAVKILRDAVAYQDLKNKAKDKKAPAPQKGKMPANRQSVPQQTTQTKRVDARFKSGRANLKDLATLFMK